MYHGTEIAVNFQHGLLAALGCILSVRCAGKADIGLCGGDVVYLLIVDRVSDDMLPLTDPACHGIGFDQLE